MAHQPEQPIWEDDVYQLALKDPVLGGPGGPANEPLLQLANRTAYLKQLTDGMQATAMLYPSVSEAQAAINNGIIPEGALFNVVSSDSHSVCDVYQNINNVAIYTGKTYPDAQVIYDIETSKISSYFPINGYLSTAGDISLDGNWGITGFIDVSSLIVPTIRLRGAPNVSSVAFYDVAYAFLSGVSAISIGGYVDKYPDVPVTAKYVRFTFDRRSPTTQSFLPLIKPDSLALTENKYRQKTLDGIFSRAGYIDTTGTLKTDANWQATNLIDLTCWIVADVLLYGHPLVGSIAYYDKNQVFVSCSSATSIGARVGGPLKIPVGAKYVAFTIYKNSTFNQAIAPIPIIDKIPDSDIAKGIFRTDVTAGTTSSGYIDKSGVVRADSNWLHSDFIACQDGVYFSFSVIGHTNVNALSFYSDNKSFISGVAATQNNAQFSGAIVAPDGAHYVRCSYGNPASSVFPVGLKNTVLMPVNLITNFLAQASQSTSTINSEVIYTQHRKLALQSSDKILLYGDSISSTDYPWYRESMEALTGAQVYNGGFSGNTAAQLASNDRLQRIFDYDAKLIVALVGGNDTGAPGTVGTFSGGVDGEPVVTETDVTIEYNGTYFIQAISHIMRRVTGYYYNIRERAGLDGTETEEEKATKIAAVLKPLLIFCTPLPQQRNNTTNPFSLPENWQRKRAAVIECCNRYSVGCIDLYSKTGFDMSVEPFWTLPTDKLTNNGCYYMDGLHPNQFGYEIIAQIVCAEVGV